MKKMISRILIPLSFLLLVQCTENSQGQGKGKTISVTEFSLKLNNSHVQILDVRTAQEFRTGHLKNAKNIDFYSKSFDSKIAKLDKRDTVLVYCKSGVRSRNSMQILIKMGYNVYNMQGGILQWEASKLPLTTKAEEIPLPNNHAGHTQVLDVRTFATGLMNTANPQLIDVRTPGEYASGHLKNAQNIDFYAADFKQKMALFNKKDTLFIYCRSGNRSGRAAQILSKMGYQVYDMQGGIGQWKAEKMSLEELEQKAKKGISKTEFDKLISSHKLVLVDFHAPWCSPCKKMSPHVEEIKNEYKGKLTVIKIDTDENPILAESLKISGIPLVKVYKNGKEVSSGLGYQTKKQLIKLFENYL